MPYQVLNDMCILTTTRANAYKAFVEEGIITGKVNVWSAMKILKPKIWKSVQRLWLTN